MTSSYTVGADAVAKIVAHAAVNTPGVTRLAPSIGGRIKGTAVRAGKRVVQAAVTDADPAADPDAVAIDPADDGGITTVTVRIVAATEPPVLQTVAAVHRAVTQALDDLPYPAELVIQVIDVDGT